MKNKLLLGVGIFCLASCKKIYTCECNTTVTYLTTSGSYHTEIIPGSKAAYTQKMTETQAKSACAHEVAAVQTDFGNGLTGNGNYVLQSGESISTDCALQ